MKRILLALTMVGFLLPLAPRAEADTEVSLDFFYDNLSPYGSWIEVADYGYCFQPNVSVDSSDWRPYADGYWAYTDVGWTWVSYEDFGWATYHYGRWANLDSYGWVWVPGYEWGPAWVSWRTGGDYIGWAPLPPQGGEVVYEGRAITGAVDVTFGIGPLYYNFVDIRYIGEPVLRGRIIEPRRNVTIINNTVNVTNITYNNTTVINNGPDLNRVNQFSTRPVQRLKLQRETTVSGDLANRRGNLNRVNGDALVVAAPAVQRSQQKFAPKQVKAKVDKPKIEHGWQGVENRQQVEAAMKKENAQNVPPPTFQPKKGKGQQAGAGQGAQANEAAPAEGGDRQAEKAARRAERQSHLDQNANQNADQAGQGAGSEQQAQRAEQRRAERAQKEKEAGMKAQPRERAEQAGNAEQDRVRRAEKAEPEQQADEQRAQQQQQARKAQRDERHQQQQQQSSQQDQAGSDRSEKAARAQQQQADSQQAERARRRAEQAQSQPAQPPPQKERAQPPQRERQMQPSQEVRRQQEARPQQGQGNQSPEEGRKGKKKKPDDDQPQP